MLENIYIVSGRPRSGTSMMMRAVIAGGLQGRYRKEQQPYKERVLENGEIYHFNPHGVFEGGVIDYSSGGGTKQVCKRFGRQLPHLPVVNNLIYNIVFLVRAEEEIIASLNTAFPRNDYSISSFWSLEKVKAYIAQRNDFNAVFLNFTDVIFRPREAFKRLATAGWPLDVDKACATVDVNLYRHRLNSAENEFIDEGYSNAY